MATPDDDSYVLIFTGELNAGVRREEALKNISYLTNLSPEALLDLLFAVKPVILQHSSDPHLARKYHTAFKEAGLKVSLQKFSPPHEDILQHCLEFSHYAPLERVETKPNYLVDTEATAKPTESSSSKIGRSGKRHSHALLFNGELKSGFDRRQVIDNLVQLTKSDKEEVVEQIFSVVPVVIKISASESELNEYQSAFSQAGLVLKQVFNNRLAPDTLVSRLRLRGDKPMPPKPYKPRPFTFSLIALCAMATLAWVGIYLTQQSLFKQQPPLSIDVVIRNAPQQNSSIANTNPAIETEPRSTPEVLTEKVPEAVPETQESNAQVKADSTPAQAARSTEKPPAPLARTPVGSSSGITSGNPRRSQPARVSAEQLERIEQNYFIELLNWYADPQHQSSLDTRNLEGEIKVEIKVSRDGELLEVNIIESSSQRLSDISLATARQASPFPPIPDEIDGDTYDFILPLKYQLDKPD